jgi:hypothetical protein
MAQLMELVDELGSLALFADLSRPQLDTAAHSFEEVWFGEGDRILRGTTMFFRAEVVQGVTGQDVFSRLPLVADVHHRVDPALRIGFDGGRDCVGPA